MAIGLPAYVVGIALCDNGSPVLGVVHDPVAGRTWSAVRGRGAFVHASGPAARPLRAAQRPVPSAPVLAWTQGHEVRRDDSTARALKVVLDTSARRVLQLWAPLLSWVMLARGDIDGIVGYRPRRSTCPPGCCSPPRPVWRSARSTAARSTTGTAARPTGVASWPGHRGPSTGWSSWSPRHSGSSRRCAAHPGRTRLGRLVSRVG
ncbi:inositol monophosphatase family protein [Micromonospora sp. BRA006-A]|nr:inositol monophosphatase family protein [Micromonospora sp. BRA006-A]